ncbi:MAG TPA: hypothetical protein VGO00_12475 [Kofleriaceae bacterium]|jgi:plastocyanin|nr:hypothetical protein [Kofleriaceae bacterium]
MKVTIAILVVVAAGIAHADPKAGRVVGKVSVAESDGKPVAGAEIVVYVVGFEEKGDVGKPAAEIQQKGRKFVPDLVAITSGEIVSFPNKDPLTHNVFSTSAAREFNLGEFKLNESKDINFPHPGVVDVYCNIHSEMAATILVLPNRRHVHANKTDGSYVLDGVPPGEWTVFAYTRRATKPVSQKVKVTAGADSNVDFAITRGVEPPHNNIHGEKYKDQGGGYH